MDDLDALFALYSDADVKKYVYSEAMTHEETKEELEWAIKVYAEQPGFGLWATIYKETGEFIGRCGLLQWTIEERPEVEVTYMLSKKYWGQGLGTEIAQALMQYGFEQLKLPRLICCIDKENQASINVATNLGMIFEKEMDTGEGPELLYSKTLVD
ncbi:MAG: GNAT family N-acetyltransferase [Anaerolineales bacterium]|nr:GNAT family N-acetyltransferase [Anaerolineales bacterium]